MENLKTEVKGNMLIMTVDLSKDLGPSKSGKSTLIATTAGNVQVAPGVMAGINIYKKAK